MKRISALLVLLSVAYYSYAQLTDDFSDGDFTNNPEWFGNTDRFQINTEELQLYDIATTNSPSSLYLDAATGGETTWEFKVRMEFNPSGSNYVKVYLNADANNFEGALNGYFVSIGGTTTDLIELKKQTGNSSTSLISSSDDYVDVGLVEVRVRVTRDASGSWELLADPTGGTNYTSLGTPIVDNDYLLGNYFGVQCIYTTSRWDKIFIDDIFIDPLFVDNIPPELQTVEINSSTEIVLRFNEPIDPASAAMSANFGISGTPAPSIVSTMIDPSDPNSVIVTLASAIPLMNFEDYIVTSTVSDINGNAALGTSAMFTFIMVEAAEPYDMLINEIMADPSPIVGLPDAEFIEIYNTTEDKVFDLMDYKVSSGSTPQQMPNYLLLPGEYVIVCDDSNISDFTISNIVAVSSFNALTNGGDNVTISNLADELIHSVNYSDDCYQDPAKDDGGWTLELINPENLCDNSCTNWIASNDVSGGTPGLENSVYAPNIILPQLNSATVLSPNTVMLEFSTEIDMIDAENSGNYAINDMNANLLSAMFFPPQSVLLTFENDLNVNTTYTITATGIHDCLGINEINLNNTATFLLTENAEPFDLIFTEIMADYGPSVGLPSAEYVEIYNRSDKVINLGNYQLSSGTSQVLPDKIIMPGEYMMICDASDLDKFLEDGMDENYIITVGTLPGLSNEADNVTLSDPTGLTINAVDYTIAWYQDPAKDEGGWSLELISPSNPCDFGQGNWRASVSEVGGTPAAENSVFEDILDEVMPLIITAPPNNPNSITVYFNEALNPTLASDPTLFSINDGEIIIQDVAIVEPGFNAVTITIDPNTSLQVQTVYELSINTGLTDCMGNPFTTDSNISFALAEEIESGDVIVNEVLFNPLTNGYDFVELYNNSDKIINLSDITIVNDAIGSNPNHPILKDYLLFPDSYAVITANSYNIANNYEVENELLLIENSIPSLSNDEGNVSLVTSIGLIDNFSYFETYHLALLDEVKGVSLERIDFNAESNDQNNWHSAAETVGFATPTYRNSQYLDSNLGNEEGYFTLTEDTFSPDNDGYKDFLQINYSVPTNGNLANIKIFDAKGRLIRDLIKSQSLATEGFYQWDGVNQEGSKARIGIYVVWIEMFDIDGNVSIEKKTCVLAGQL